MWTVGFEPACIKVTLIRAHNLLDIIDKLRSHWISRWVDLSEIIVCGDQSSGES